jgi:hypothetical protein
MTSSIFTGILFSATGGVAVMPKTALENMEEHLQSLLEQNDRKQSELRFEAIIYRDLLAALQTYKLQEKQSCPKP